MLIKLFTHEPDLDFYQEEQKLKQQQWQWLKLLTISYLPGPLLRAMNAVCHFIYNNLSSSFASILQMEETYICRS